MKSILILTHVLLVVGLFSVNPASAAQEDMIYKAEELDQMLAPIALYPDSLLAQVLMAATYPADVVEAAKWSTAHADMKGDEAVTAVEAQAWDPSVKSLVAFPQVLATMQQDADWVQNVGDAFLAQPEDVMDAVQRLRAAAQKQGNLESNEQQTVTVEAATQTQQTDAATQPPPTQQSVIVIEPANPQLVYVPAYNPTVVYGSWWYPRYPPVYLPPPPGYVFGTALMSGIAFGVGISITNSLWGGCNWHSHSVDINVNRYNNINVNRKLDVNKKDVTWNHNADNRRGVPYRDAKSRERYGRQVAGSDQRNEFRGRDPQREASREKAQATLKNRGIDPAQGRENLRNDPQTRDRARAAAKNADRDKARSAAQNIDRDRARQASRQSSRGTAFTGASTPDRSRQNISRGKASRQSMHRGGGKGHGGGGGRRG